MYSEPTNGLIDRKFKYIFHALYFYYKFWGILECTWGEIQTGGLGKPATDWEFPFACCFLLLTVTDTSVVPLQQKPKQHLQTCALFLLDKWLIIPSTPNDSNMALRPRSQASFLLVSLFLPPSSLPSPFSFTQTLCLFLLTLVAFTECENRNPDAHTADGTEPPRAVGMSW